MTTLTSNDQPTTLATSTVSLRIIQPGADDRTVPLSTGKCTVGSSDRCQVHLRDAQVRPLHCLIVHETTGTLVTRWAPGAMLNDQDFATAPFHPGDCLQIGDVQLLLVAEANDASEPQAQPATLPVAAATNAFAMPAPTPAAFASPTPSPIAPVEQPVAEAISPVLASLDTKVVDTLEADRLVGRLKTANDGARKRCRNLIGSLRTMRTEASSFDQKIDELQQQLSLALVEREQIFSQLSQLQGEAGERESQSSEEIDRLISELTAAYEKASVAEAGLAEHVQQAEQSQTELASLQGQSEQWEQIRSAGDLQRAKLSEALADRERAIETLQTEIEQSREAASQAEMSIAEQTTALEALQAELEQVQSEREQLAAGQSESRQRQQDAEQSQADSEQNLAVFQLELEKFQITSRNTEQELLESKLALEDLQAEFAPLAEQRDQLVSKHTEYQLREQGWEHELASRDGQIEELSNEIEQLRTSVNEANEGAASQVSLVENFQQQLDALTTERDQLLTAQAEQVLQIQEHEEQVAARDRRIKELEEEHVGICEMLQTVEKGAFEQVDSCNKLEQQLANLRAERDQLAEALPEQQEYIKQLEQSLPERDGQIAVLSDELTKTSQRQMELETELAQGTSAYQALEAELSERSARCEQLAAEHITDEQSKADVEQTLVEYQGLIEELQQQIETIQQQRQELVLEVATGSESSETYRTNLAELQARCENLTTDLQAETERRHERDSQLADQQQDVELFQVDLQSVRGELERSVEQVSSLQTERDTLNQQLTGLREELAASELAADEKGEGGGGGEGGEDASVSQELLTQLEDEKALLQQRVEEQDQQTEQLSTELEQVRQSLLAAEQTLQEFAAEQEQASVEPVDVPAEPYAETPDAKSLDYEAEYAAEADSYGEAPQESVEYHDAYKTDETSGSEDVYGTEADNPASDKATEDLENSEIAEPIAEPIEATSTAFDRQEPEAEETAEEFQPTSFIDQYQHLLEEDEEANVEPVQPEPEPEPAPVENKLGAELDAVGTGSEEDSDEALQAYMSNMLRRMRGDENDDASQPPQVDSGTTLNQNPNPVAAVDDVLDQVAPEREAIEEPQNTEPIDLEQLKRSSAKPTLPTDLSAMRELANSSARRAIAKHHKRRHLEKALGLFLACLIAVGVGGYMLLAGYEAQDFLGLKFLGGAAAALVGVVGGFKMLGLLLLAIREGSWEKKKPAKETPTQD